MPVLKDGSYRLPYPYQSEGSDGWEIQSVRRTDGGGGMETVNLLVERPKLDFPWKKVGYRFVTDGEGNLRGEFYEE